VTGVKLADDVFSGANNTDGGGIGVDDAAWNPHNSVLVKLSAKSPPDFGPSFGGVHIFGDWSLSSSTRWVQGDEFTWYPSDYLDIKLPNNRRWEDRWNTNLNVTRNIHLMNNVSMRLFVQVTNLFNSRHLRQLGGTELDNYMTAGILPFQSTTKEPTEWNWYTNQPRQIYFGTTIEF